MKAYSKPKTFNGCQTGNIKAQTLLLVTIKKISLTVKAH